MDFNSHTISVLTTMLETLISSISQVQKLTEKITEVQDTIKDSLASLFQRLSVAAPIDRLLPFSYSYGDQYPALGSNDHLSTAYGQPDAYGMGQTSDGLTIPPPPRSLSSHPSPFLVRDPFAASFPSTEFETRSRVRLGYPPYS